MIRKAPNRAAKIPRNHPANDLNEAMRTERREQAEAELEMIFDESAAYEKMLD